MGKHTYHEAFMLMKYATRDGSETELLWNSRDGITPFVIPSKTGREMSHVDWPADRYLPDHKPKSGDRIFIDLTPVEAEKLAAEQVERWWSHHEHPMSLRYESKEEAVKILAKEMLERWLPGGSPDIAVVP